MKPRALHLGFARLERLFPAGTFLAAGELGGDPSAKVFRANKNEINATLWQRSRGQGTKARRARSRQLNDTSFSFTE